MRVSPARVYAMARSKAFLRRGVKILWRCPESMVEGTDIPAETLLCFPGGLADRLAEMTGKSALVTTEAFTGKVERPDGSGGVEWAMAWSNNGFGSEADGFCQTYCNTVPTPQGGTHEQGFRAAITKGLRAYADHSQCQESGADHT